MSPKDGEAGFPKNLATGCQTTRRYIQVDSSLNSKLVFMHQINSVVLSKLFNARHILMLALTAVQTAPDRLTS